MHVFGDTFSADIDTAECPAVDKHGSLFGLSVAESFSMSKDDHRPGAVEKVLRVVESDAVFFPHLLQAFKMATDN